MKYFEFCEEFLRAIEYKRIALSDGNYYLEMENFPAIIHCPFCGKKLENYDSLGVEKESED